MKTKVHYNLQRHAAVLRRTPERHTIHMSCHNLWTGHLDMQRKFNLYSTSLLNVNTTSER